jgi:hypothetical protein
MKWLRLYDDLLDDPKAQQLPPSTFKHWINLLCLASKGEPRGTLPDLSAIAFRLRLTEPKATALLTELSALGFIDRDDDGTLRPHNWEGRQRMSDNVADRVRKHRAAVSGNDHVTLQKRTVDTDTDTDTEKDRNLAVSVSPKPPKTRTVKTPDPVDLAEAISADVWAEIAAEQGLSDDQLRFETAQMLDHYRGNAERRADWVACWRNWMRSPYRKTKPASAQKVAVNGFTLEDEREFRKNNPLLRVVEP